MEAIRKVPGRRPRRPVVKTWALMLGIALLAAWLGRKTETARSQRRLVDGFHASRMPALRNCFLLYNYESYDWREFNYDKLIFFRRKYGDVLFSRYHDGIDTAGPSRLAARWLAGRLGAEYAGDITRIKVRGISYQWADGRELNFLGGLRHLEALDLSGQMNREMADSVARQSEHPEWKGIYLNQFLTDERLDQLNLYRHGDLVYLNLSHNAIGDAGLVHLAGMRRLRSLNLTTTLIGDAGLVHIAKLRSLEELFLSRTDVGDAGLVHLGRLGGLRFLELNGTRVSPAGVAGLKRKLPGLVVQYP